MLTKLLKRFVLTLAILPVLISQPALAHVIWFDYDDGKYELLFGHPEQESTEALELSKFQEATAYNLTGNIIATETKIEDENLFIVPEAEIAALTGFYDNGFWLSTPDGSSQNISQEEAESVNYENVTNFVKYTKGIYDWSEKISEPLGLPLEIVSLMNPLEVMAGENLPIQVLFNGNTITGAKVEYLGEELTVDEEGIALVPIGMGGLEVIEASYNPTENNLLYPISYATTFSAEQISDATTVPKPSILVGIGLVSLMAVAGKRNLIK